MTLITLLNKLRQLVAEKKFVWRLRSLLRAEEVAALICWILITERIWSNTKLQAASPASGTPVKDSANERCGIKSDSSAHAACLMTFYSSSAGS